MNDAQEQGGAARDLGPISAVVVNYNGEAYLEACLRSSRHRRSVDEIVVVENASPTAPQRPHALP